MSTERPSPSDAAEQAGCPAAVSDTPREAARRPWITCTAILACVAVHVGLAFEGDQASWESLSRWGYLPAASIWNGAYWALISSVFVHAETWHVLFNVYWLWRLGSRVERMMGSLRFLGFFLAAALVSSSSQLALCDDTGIGASGVAYAYFGLMWVLRRRYAEFERTLDRRTIRLLVVWLLGCLVVTHLGIWQVANAAHVSGLLFGVSFAGFFSARHTRRLLLASLGLLVAFAITPLFWCPWSVVWLGNRAHAAHVAQQYDDALGLYTRIIRTDPANAWAYSSRGHVYRALGDTHRAEKDFEMAGRLCSSRPGRPE